MLIKCNQCRNSINISSTMHTCPHCGHSKWRSVIIDNSASVIEARAFKDFEELEDITIPSTITSIGKSAFENCRNLKSILIPNSVTVIENGAFFLCESLTTVTIPNSVTRIEEYAFGNCGNLKNVIIPNSISKLSSDVFTNSGLMSVTIPNSVNEICYGAFSFCKNLTSITIPNSVTKIEQHAFADCKNLKDITIPDSVIQFDAYAFQWCESLKNVTAPTRFKEYFPSTINFKSVEEQNDAEKYNTNVFYTKLAGTTFEGRQKIIFELKSKGMLNSGQALILQREFDNLYDKNAIQVIHPRTKQMLGYISKDVASRIAPELDSNTEFVALVEAVTGGTGYNYGINIRIYSSGEATKPSSFISYNHNTLSSDTAYNVSEDGCYDGYDDLNPYDMDDGDYEAWMDSLD